MADQAESTCVPENHPTHPLIPPGWDESAGFRATFLYHFQRPDDLGALRHLARMLHESELEMKRYAPLTADSATHEELRAAAADLRHLQGFLGSVARAQDEAALSPSDTELAALAARQAVAVAGVAAVLERALGEG
jgi:hypothetical protein